MINYEKKAEIQPSANDVEDNRFEQIRRAAAEKHRQLDRIGRDDRKAALKQP